MKHASPASAMAALLVALACTQPDDRLFVPPTVPPVEGSGALRVTFNPGPDFARGFDPGGRLIYRSRGLPPFGDVWVLLSMPPNGGTAREEVTVYRQALRSSVGQLLFGDWGRVLVAWQPPVPYGADGCGPPAPPPPPVVSLGVYRLGAEDGEPLRSAFVRLVTVPAVEGRSTLFQTIRSMPALREVDSLGVDAFGPAVGADGVGYFSDGQTLWSFDLLDPTAPAESIGVGAFPSLSPDGRVLAAAVAVGVDSTIDTTSVGAGFSICVQQTVRITATGWEVELHDLSSGAVTNLGSGLEPRFDPLAARLLVRRDALYWIPLGGGSSEIIPNTEGAHSPAIAPDGSIVAFSIGGATDADVYVVRIR